MGELSASLLCLAPGRDPEVERCGCAASRRDCVQETRSEMFYQFNNFTGRLGGSAHIHPYFPVSAQPLERREPPKIIFHSKHEQMARVAPPIRHASQNLIPGTNTPYGPLPENLRRKMELFQKRDGVPVHLKGGPLDKALFGLTLALCAVGLFETFRFFYVMSTPKN